MCFMLQHASRSLVLQTAYELQRNEVLVRAAQLTAQFGVDMAVVLNDGVTGGTIKYASQGTVETGEWALWRQVRVARAKESCKS